MAIAPQIGQQRLRAAELHHIGGEESREAPCDPLGASKLRAATSGTLSRSAADRDHPSERLYRRRCGPRERADPPIVPGQPPPLSVDRQSQNILGLVFPRDVVL